MKSLKEILESEKYPMIKLVDKENKEIEVEELIHQFMIIL